MQDIAQQTVKDQHRQLLSELVHQKLQNGSAVITLEQVRADVDCLLNDDALEKLFQESGRVKTRWLPVSCEWMHGVINPLTSDYKCGKLPAAELVAEQRERVDNLKSRVVRRNLDSAKRKNTCNGDTEGNNRLHLVKSVIDEATYNENGSLFQEKLASAWQECLQDMDLVDRWAYGVWRKRGIPVID